MSPLTFSYILIFLFIGYALESKAIIRGKDAERCQFKFFASILSKNFNRCGGGLLDSTHILTAAHCVTENYPFFNYTGIPISILVGTNNLKQTSYPAVTVNVSKIYLDGSDVDKMYLYLPDIAVLKLEKPLDLKHNECLDVLRLPTRKPLHQEDALVMGHGVRSPVSGAPSDLQQYAEYYVYDNNQCQQELIAFYSNSVLFDIFKGKYMEYYVCAKVKNEFDNMVPTGACKGDSGSPLVTNNKTVVGISIFTNTNCTGIPLVTTSVWDYLPFIRNAMNDKDCQVVINGPTDVCVL